MIILNIENPKLLEVVACRDGKACLATNYKLHWVINCKLFPAFLSYCQYVLIIAEHNIDTIWTNTFVVDFIDEKHETITRFGHNGSGTRAGQAEICTDSNDWPLVSHMLVS